uniref:Major sperm protein n=1 Tax=Caenorhabditis japonica TaxID=281687 RepID=A0A8R1IEJ7_CAEJA
MTSPSSNKNEYRITPVGSKDVAITLTAETPRKDKPFVQFAPAPADALAVFAFVTPAGTLTITIDENEDTEDDIEYDYIDTEAVEDPGKIRDES